MQAQWRIDMFGGLRVTANGNSLTHFVMRRAGVLLARLALAPNRVHSREELMEMLWPEEDVESTRLRFRQVLTTLRRSLASLGADVDALLIAERADLRMASQAVITDVEEFEAAVRAAGRQDTAEERAGCLEQALIAYRDELLPGYYEDWVLTERQRLADKYVDTLGLLAATYAEQGKSDEAIETARRAINVDPLREEGHCSLIRLYIEVGRLSQAIRHYREMEQVLWKEFRVVPSPEAQSLLEKARTQQARPVIPVPPISTVEQDSAAESPAPPPFPPLVLPLTTFFGRDDDIAAIEALLSPTQRTPSSDIRVVTLTGPGGSGKTRLALEVARRRSDALKGAVCFVALADVQDPRLIVSSIADTLGVEEKSTEDSFKLITEMLRPRPALMVLDNLEQIVEAGGQVVRDLIQSVPSLRCLVTSRQRLNIEGEQEYAVLPLHIPETETPGELDAEQALRLAEQTASPLLPMPNSDDDIPGALDLMQYASVALFVDRAKRVRSGFTVTPENADAIAQLCRRLEGIPLALELAATWASALTPAQINERLSRRFDLLVSSRKDLPQRHRSLWATLEWSYQRLTPDLQTFFRQLSIFQGRWTLETAEAICERPDTLDGLEQLRQHSLIQAEEQDGEMRFRMLTTMQEFAAEKRTDEETNRMRKRHATYFMVLCEQFEPAFLGPEQLEWQTRLRAEQDNLRQALAWSAGPEGEAEVGLRIMGAIHRYWGWRIANAEAERWFEALLPHLDSVPEAVQAKALEAAGTLVDSVPNAEKALARFDASLALYRKLGDAHGIARIYQHQGGTYAFYREDIAKARALLEESVEMFRTLKDPVRQAISSAMVSVVARREGDYSSARAALEYAAAMHRLSGYRTGIAWCLFMMGRTALESGDYVTALPLFHDSLILYRRLENRGWVIACLFNIGNIQQALGDLEAARATCREGLYLSRTTGDVRIQATYLTWSGDLTCREPDYSTAHAFYQEALLLSEQGGYQLAYPVLFQRLACLSAAQGEMERALRLLAAYSVRIGELRLEVPESIALATATDPDQLRTAVGDAVFQRVWRQGEEMTLEQALSYAKNTL